MFLEIAQDCVRVNCHIYNIYLQNLHLSSVPDFWFAIQWSSISITKEIYKE